MFDYQMTTEQCQPCPENLPLTIPDFKPPCQENNFTTCQRLHQVFTDGV